MLKRKTCFHAPAGYWTKEALAWAAGYNTAVADQEMPPRKAECGDVGFGDIGSPTVKGNHRVRSDWWFNSPLSPGFRPYAGQTVRVTGMHPALGAGYRREQPRNVSARIQEYLVLGGLFNPELANHQAVRNLLLDARDTIEALKAIANR